MTKFLSIELSNAAPEYLFKLRSRNLLFCACFLVLCGSAAEITYADNCISGWTELEAEYMEAFKAQNYVQLRALREKRKVLENCSESEQNTVSANNPEVPGPQPELPGSGDVSSVGASDVTQSPATGDTIPLPPEVGALPADIGQDMDNGRIGATEVDAVSPENIDPGIVLPESIDPGIALPEHGDMTSTGASDMTQSPIAGDTVQLPSEVGALPTDISQDTGNGRIGATEVDAVSPENIDPGFVFPEPADMTSVGASEVTQAPISDDSILRPVGGETISPRFGTQSALLSEMASHSSATASTIWEAWGHFARGEPSRITPLVARYGNWVGEGWWGASEMTDKVGAQPPIDALDRLAQEHDFAYGLAEEAGKKYGDAEKNRLLALADEASYRAFQNLPKDPADWKPPPTDLEAAARFRDRFPITMQGLAYTHETARKNAAPPTPQQARAMRERGSLNAAEFQVQARQRVDSWNRDQGQAIRKQQSGQAQ